MRRAAGSGDGSRPRRSADHDLRRVQRDDARAQLPRRLPGAGGNRPVRRALHQRARRRRLHLELQGRCAGPVPWHHARGLEVRQAGHGGVLQAAVAAHTRAKAPDGRPKGRSNGRSRATRRFSPWHVRCNSQAPRRVHGVACRPDRREGALMRVPPPIPDPEDAITYAPGGGDMRYFAAADIAAPPDAVWAILTRADAYPEWEPNTTKVEGSIEAGSQITVHTKLSSQAFPVTVSELEAPRCMEWTGGMPLGLFKGVRRFTLRASESGTHFEVEENFSGPLLFLMRRMMPDLQPSFDDFAAALKQAAER
ncbi:MAG: SRPBCC domain-containing protein [Deltaproteobacteria bacterium]|nr:MAG: SRPBCC domain-containing protein [Deltaproteobacteria bacterium]